MGHLSKVATILVAGIILAIAAPAIADTRTPTHTTIGVGRGQGFDTLGVAVIEGPTHMEMALHSGPPITFTIRNATTRQQLRSFKMALDVGTCAIRWTTTGNRIRFSGRPQTLDVPYEACKIRPFSGPRKDHYTVTARFVGNASFKPSTSPPYTL